MKTTWEYSFMSGYRKKYTIEGGTETDKALVNAFFAFNKDEILKLLECGANLNLTLTVESGVKEMQVQKGKIMDIMLMQEPIKPFFAPSSSVRSTDRNENIRAEREARIARSRKIERVAKQNDELANKTIDLLEFWEDLGGETELENYDEIKIEKVRKYVVRQDEVFRIVDKRMAELNLPIDEHTAKIFFNKSKQYRTSDMTIDEIRSAVENDPIIDQVNREENRNI